MYRWSDASNIFLKLAPFGPTSRRTRKQTELEHSEPTAAAGNQNLLGCLTMLTALGELTCANPRVCLSHPFLYRAYLSFCPCLYRGPYPYPDHVCQDLVPFRLSSH